MEIQKMINMLAAAILDVEQIETHGNESCAHVVTAVGRIRGVMNELEQMQEERKRHEYSGDEVPA